MICFRSFRQLLHEWTKGAFHPSVYPFFISHRCIIMIHDCSRMFTKFLLSNRLPLVCLHLFEIWKPLSFLLQWDVQYALWHYSFLMLILDLINDICMWLDTFSMIQLDYMGTEAFYVPWWQSGELSCFNYSVWMFFTVCCGLFFYWSWNKCWLKVELFNYFLYVGSCDLHIPLRTGINNI